MIEYLAGIAEKGAPLCFTKVFFDNNIAITLALLFGMRQPMLAKRIFLFPLQEIEAVITGFLNQFGHLSWWQVAKPGFGMHLDAVQHFILNDIAHTGEYHLIQQGISNHDMW